MKVFHILERKPRVFFIYAERYKKRGSTIMRGQQLAKIFKTHYGNYFRVGYRPISLRYRNSILILTKCAVMDITTEHIKMLRGRGNRILLDFVDDPMNLDKAHAANAVIAASWEAHDNYNQLGLRSFTVNHHVDLRLQQNSKNLATGFRCGYFGELVNTIKTDAISKYVDFIQVDTGRQTNDWLDKPIRYSLHYGIRANNTIGFKPFLKGFTAAACGANIIIQKDQTEAIYWLGEDYPFLIKPNPAEKDITNMLSHIQTTYGSDEWKSALNKMEKIREATSDKSIATELYNAIQSLKD